ncbi:MAG TPA: hypothetical protein VHD32_00220 [Candidatus Didemnitutus sp.]|nr:hypothetical protein [Candidatus Didemnitutus sp.]
MAVILNDSAKESMRALTFSLIAASLVGCSVITDQSSHYRDFVGAEFVTRKEQYLLRLDEYQYGFVPLTLEESPTALAPYSHLQEKIPVGARVKIVQARYRPSIDAGFDYFIGDLFLPGQPSPIRFEQFVGTPEQAPKFLRLWQRIP